MESYLKHRSVVSDFGQSSSAYGGHLPGFRSTSIQEFGFIFPNEDSCLNHLLLFRTLGKPRCNRCGAITKDWRRHEGKKHFYHGCGGIYSPMVGTIFERTQVGLHQWFYVMLLLASSPLSSNISFIARQAGVSEQTALTMAKKIRVHMAAIDAEESIGGPSNSVVTQLQIVRRVTSLKCGAHNRVTLLLLSDAVRVLALVLPNPSQASLRAAIGARVLPGSVIVTDCHRVMSVDSNYGGSTNTISWSLLEYGQEYKAKQAIHGFLAVLFQALKDQFRSVLHENLWLYLKEFEFRYNRRACSRMCFWEMVSNWPDMTLHSLENLCSKNMFLSSAAVVRGR